MKVSTVTRVMATSLSVVSYILLTSGFTVPGVIVNLMVQLLFIPFAAQSKAWDMICLSCVFAVINVQTLICHLL